MNSSNVCFLLNSDNSDGLKQVCDLIKLKSEILKPSVDSSVMNELKKNILFLTKSYIILVRRDISLSLVSATFSKINNENLSE